MMLVSVLFVSLLASANAFTAPMSNRVAFVTSTSTSMPARSNVNLMMGQENEEESSGFSVPAVPAMTAAIWASLSTSALADSPDWGIFEGRIGSLLHPVTMISLLALSVSTALLGFDWRRQRTIGDDISVLKKSLPALGGAASVSEALTAARAAESPDNAMISKFQAALSVDDEIKAMQAERKELSAKGPRDQHWNQGVTLALIGTVFAIEGPLNTYARAGKLFPGPHLYAGAGLVCLWALAGACVPAMQKGNDTARIVHIGANSVGIGMFVWQVTSGIPILLKVIEKTQWP
jgi:hypothetical protein